MKPKTIKYKIIAGNNIEKSLFLDCILQVTPSPKDLCKLYLEFSDIKYLAELRETRIERAAREIMGRNYIGRIELAEIFGDILMGEEIEKIPALPANIIEILQSPCPFRSHWYNKKIVAKTHILFLMPRILGGRELTIMKWAELEKTQNSQYIGKLLYNTNWYKDEKFANTPIESTQWVLMPKEMLPESTNKTWQEQLKELQKYPDYEVPNAVSVVSGVFLHYLKTGDKLYRGSYKDSWYLLGWDLHHVRTSSKRASGYRVGVGYFASDGLHVAWFDDSRGSGLGVAARRKFV